MESLPHDPANPASYTFWTDERVRFADLDLMGHVNNVAFAVYFESGRVAILRETKLYTPTENRALVLAHISVDYLAEIHFPADLRIGTRINRIGRSSFEIGCAVFVDGRCAATGHGVSVRVDRAQRRPVPLTEDEVARLKRFMVLREQA